MKPGLTMDQVVAEVDRQSKAKRDFRAPTKLLRVEPVHASNDDSLSSLELVVGDKGRFLVNRHATNQIAGRLQIPKKYWDLMAEKNPALLAHNVNEWFKANGDAALVRTLDDAARAYLTPRYRTIDHDAVVRTLLPTLKEVGVEVRSCQITPSRLYVQVSAPGLTDEVEVGDVVQMGVVVSNSEVGSGSYRIDQMLYRLRCKNGLIVGEVARKNHVGRSIAGDDEETREVYSEQTLALDDLALLSKVRDTVRAFLSPMALSAVVNAAKKATRVKIADLLGAAQAVDEIVELNESERGLFRRNLINGDDGAATGWRVVNALTAVAHDTNDYDRAVELERAGGKLLALTEQEWSEVAEHVYDPKLDLAGVES